MSSNKPSDTVEAIVAMLRSGETDAGKLFSLVGAGKVTQDDAAAALTLHAERIAAQAAAGIVRALSCKVTEKGGVSVYGLNARFPVTLYGDQWARLIEFGPTILAFCKSNQAKLSVKAAK